MQSNAGTSEAVTLAHPPSLISSLALGCRLFSLIGDAAVLDNQAGQLIAAATEQRFPLYAALGTIYRGWGKCITGDMTEGISLLRSGSSVYSATGAQTRISYHVALLAQAYENAGETDEALSALNHALQIAAGIGERWYTAELYRHKGQVMLRLADSVTAEELYRRALAIAEEQDAKLWKLRAAVSLARLLANQDRRCEAHDVLAPIYEWFTEGFNTPDLTEAKKLLDGLS